MKTKWRRPWCILLPAALLLITFDASANAADFLWISAPNWSYSAAAATSPAGTAYYWGLSVGPTSYSYAGAFSTSPFGSAAAFAVASAGGLGGFGAADAAGIADPWSGVGIDIGLTDPSNPSGYPTSIPGSNPLWWPYTITDLGITFSSDSSSEMNGTDGIEAFYYTGGTDTASLENDFGASDMGDQTSTGDVTDVTALMSDFGSTLIPLDGLVTDPNGLANMELLFNENVDPLTFNPNDVILVGEGDAASTPEPTELAALIGMGALALLLVARRGRKVLPSSRESGRARAINRRAVAVG